MQISVRPLHAKYALLLFTTVNLSTAQLANEDDEASPLPGLGIASPADVVVPDVVVAAAHIWMAALMLVLVGLLAAVYMQPAWLMGLLVRHSHSCVLWCVETSTRVCSLTIDDAPSASTPLILDLLRDHGVKATFFIISDHIAGNEEVMRRIVREGHRLGNHLTEDRASILDELHVFEHKLRECDAAIAAFQPTSDVGQSVASASLEDTEPLSPPAATVATASTRLLAPTTGSATIATYGSVASKWLRPASGWFTSNMREIVQSHGYKICMGSVYPHDAQIKSEQLNALFLKLRTRPGSVLIVHDRAWTVGVLREALPALVAKFKFVSLDELQSHHHSHRDHQHKASHKVQNVT